MRNSNFEDEISRFVREREAEESPLERNDIEDDGNILPDPPNDLVVPGNGSLVPDNAVPDDGQPSDRPTVERFVAPDQCNDEEYAQLMG
jgi:hypothetical protein